MQTARSTEILRGTSGRCVQRPVVRRLRRWRGSTRRSLKSVRSPHRSPPLCGNRMPRLRISPTTSARRRRSKSTRNQPHRCYLDRSSRHRATRGRSARQHAGAERGCGRAAPFGDPGGSDLDGSRRSTPGPTLCGGPPGPARDCRTRRACRAGQRPIRRWRRRGPGPEMPLVHKARCVRRRSRVAVRGARGRQQWPAYGIRA